MDTGLRSADGIPLVWPVPEECALTGGTFPLEDGLTIRHPDELAYAASFISSAMAEEGVTTRRAGTESELVLDLVEDPELGEEGYRLEVGRDRIEVTGRTPRGVFYGLQSLAQIVSRGGRKIGCHRIFDAPLKPVRGVHLFLPPRAHLEWFRRLVDFLVTYKYNTVFLEIGAAMEFDSHPEINAAWERFCAEMMSYPGGPDGNAWGDDGMQMRVGHIKNSVHIENGGRSFLTKSEVSALVRYMKDRHVDVIPEVQTLSHSYWLLLAHPECAERSDDPYPDTYCPSNPRTYEIALSCMQEVLEAVKPRTVSLGHDEYHSIGICERCRGRTGHDILAQDVLLYHGWLAARGVRTHVWGDKLMEVVKMDEREIGMPVGGAEYISFNQRTRRAELVRPTWRAVDMIPGDVLIGDWYYTMTAGEDTGSQDHFGQRGLQVIFGNFNPSAFPNVEDRLRRPNVLGAEVSLWQETSELGMAMTDGLVRYLDAANVLWSASYDSRDRGEYNRSIAAIYPEERERMNGRSRPRDGRTICVPIDISEACNAPLHGASDYRFMLDAGCRVPRSLPFIPLTAGKACVQVGSGAPEAVRGIRIHGRYRSLAFLHSYTRNLGGPPRHPCSYVGPEDDLVGSYVLHYGDGSSATVPVEYSRTIVRLESAFGAHRADPVFQKSEARRELESTPVSMIVRHRLSSSVVFAHEWVNPFPEKEIAEVDVEHDPRKPGSIVLFGIMGCAW